MWALSNNFLVILLVLTIHRVSKLNCIDHQTIPEINYQLAEKIGTVDTSTNISDNVEKIINFLILHTRMKVEIISWVPKRFVKVNN